MPLRQPSHTQEVSYLSIKASPPEDLRLSNLLQTLQTFKHLKRAGVYSVLTSQLQALQTAIKYSSSWQTSFHISKQQTLNHSRPRAPLHREIDPESHFSSSFRASKHAKDQFTLLPSHARLPHTCHKLTCHQHRPRRLSFHQLNGGKKRLSMSWTWPLVRHSHRSAQVERLLRPEHVIPVWKSHQILWLQASPKSL
jgi:hypothetical protein